MASGAGLNQINATVLTINDPSTVSAVATPLAGYGTIGVNDSGAVLFEGQGFTKITATMTSAGDMTGLEVTLYGTNDPITWQVWQTQIQGAGSWNAISSAWASQVPASSWKKLPGPSEQNSGGGSANPLTVVTSTLIASGPWKAYRAVVTAGPGAGTNPVSINLELVP